MGAELCDLEGLFDVPIRGACLNMSWLVLIMAFILCPYWAMLMVVIQMKRRSSAIMRPRFLSEEKGIRCGVDFILTVELALSRSSERF